MRLECEITMTAPQELALSMNKVVAFLSCYLGDLYTESGQLYKARCRLYRSHNLQVNTRWKAVAEIYTTHSFAPFLESNRSLISIVL